MPSAAARALSHSSSNSSMRAWSAFRSSSTESAISRCFAAICSSKSARSLNTFSNFALNSVICWSFSAPRAFQFSIVLFKERIVSCCDRLRFSKSCLSLDKLLANTSKPAGPSSRISNLFSNCCSSYSNSPSLSSPVSVLTRGGLYWPFRFASAKASLKDLHFFFNLVHSSADARRSFIALFNCPCICVLSRMASSRCTTARPTLSTKSAISFTRLREPGSPTPLWARPRCRSFTSAMCAFRISVIMETASCASRVHSPASRLDSMSSFCKASACSRPLRNSRSNR
mmetsp:Transcript_124576/g.360265  ORF Transcript_124576/g.360265 Transcript_124576/m.360265 type:complete len:286 (+) Transcript_124576:744-1601(+)